MSILIKGTNKEDLQRALLTFSGHEIVELLDHGDLIDRDNLIYELGEEDEDLSTYHTLLYAPVVIPAERSNDGET